MFLLVRHAYGVTNEDTFKRADIKFCNNQGDV